MSFFLDPSYSTKSSLFADLLEEMRECDVEVVKAKLSLDKKTVRLVLRKSVNERLIYKLLIRSRSLDFSLIAHKNNPYHRAWLVFSRKTILGSSLRYINNFTNFDDSFGNVEYVFPYSDSYLIIDLIKKINNFKVRKSY